MKKICLMVCVVLFCASLAFGDEVEESLSTLATEQVKINTRAMINAGINSDGAIKMTRLMLENRFSEEHALRAHQIIMNAHQQGLPVEPIMGKAHEGMAKQVEAKNIVRAMEQVRSRYAFAHEQARALTHERSEIRTMANTIAKGLAAGMNQEDIRGITNMLQERARQMTRAQTMELAQESFKATRDMARLGLSSKDTTDLVCLALQNQYTARDMETMSNSFMTHSRSSAPPHVAKSYSAGIKGGKSSDSLGYSGSSEPGVPSGPGGPSGPSGPGGPSGPSGPSGPGGPGGGGGSMK